MVSVGIHNRCRLMQRRKLWSTMRDGGVSDCVNFNESGTVLLLANCGYEEEVSCGRGEDGKEGRELMDSCMFTDSRFLLSLSLPCSLYYDEYGFA